MLTKDPLIARLAQAYQILHLEGQGDSTLGHVSARSADGKSFWIKRADRAFDEVADEGDLQLLDFAGNMLKGNGPLHSEWPIHAEVLARRPEIGSVIHTHSPHAALLSACGSVIEPLTIEGGYFSDRETPLYRAPKAHIDDMGVAREMTDALGSAMVLFIRNHGIVACGADIAQATLAAMFVDRAARVQIQAYSLRIQAEPASRQEMSGRAAMLHSPVFVEQYFAACARRAARIL
jgi:L-fuculose-phosphate aldolase